jgi:hypothetical protein
MPTAVRRDDRVSLLRPPAVALVQANAMMVLEDRINYYPRGLNRIFSCEERAVAGHGVAEKPFVGRFVSRPLFRQVKLFLLSDEILARDLDARGKCNSWIG